MLSPRGPSRYPRPDWVTIGVAIATVATILAGASVTGFILVSQSQLQTVPADLRFAVRIGVAIYGILSLFAYGATLVNALATIFDPNDVIRHEHVRSAAKYFLIQGIMIVVFATLVIMPFGLAADGTSEADDRSSHEPSPTGASSGLGESSQADYCPALGRE